VAILSYFNFEIPVLENHSKNIELQWFIVGYQAVELMKTTLA